MKFSKLTDRFKHLVKKSTKKIKKWEELQDKLTDKKAHYEKRLKSKLKADDRKSLETRLKVVNAQLKKVRQVISKAKK